MAREDQIDKLQEDLKEIACKQDKQLEHLNAINISMARQETAFLAHLKQDEQMYVEMRDMNEKLEVYNKELAVHIAGVQELRKSNKLLEKKIEILQDMWESEKKLTEARINKLEEPRIWLSMSKKYLLFLAAIAGALAAILGAIEAIKSI
jgi:chromosome segregation ATPase